MDSYGTYDGKKEEPPYKQPSEISEEQIAEVIRQERERAVRALDALRDKCLKYPLISGSQILIEAIAKINDPDFK